MIARPGATTIVVKVPLKFVSEFVSVRLNFVNNTEASNSKLFPKT